MLSIGRLIRLTLVLGVSLHLVCASWLAFFVDYVLYNSHALLKCVSVHYKECAFFSGD